MRISNFSSYCYERVVFPAERIFFEALAEDFLEVYVGATISTFLTEKILCNRLRINQTG